MALAGKDREARVFGIARIAGGEFAEQKRAAAVGLDTARMNAIGAQARIQLRLHLWFGFFHGNRIAQTSAEALNRDHPAGPCLTGCGAAREPSRFRTQRC